MFDKRLLLVIGCWLLIKLQLTVVSLLLTHGLWAVVVVVVVVDDRVFGTGLSAVKTHMLGTDVSFTASVNPSSSLNTTVSPSYT